jgi:ribonuclease Z
LRNPLQARLVNAPFKDPGLYVELIHGRRAFLFDMGELAPLSVRQVLRVSEAFVSHMHMDHFAGFDAALRLWLGREKTVRLFGPLGFLAAVEHKLRAYSWNLVRGYEEMLTLEVSEIGPGGCGRRARFPLGEAFARTGEEEVAFPQGVLLDEANFEARAVTLDHGIPCLAFAIREKLHVNVFKNRLAEHGLGKGPWLRELKALVLQGASDDTPVTASWRVGEERVERAFTLGWLKREILDVVPGPKIAYVTDAVGSEANAARIVELARDAETLFIEAAFLDRDAGRAARRRHLTARQAGTLARLAGARRVVPFHFSPRHEGEEDALRAEVERAFRGG